MQSLKLMVEHQSKLYSLMNLLLKNNQNNVVKIVMEKDVNLILKDNQKNQKWKKKKLQQNNQKKKKL